MEKLSGTLLWNIFKHVQSWLTNLNRASEARQQQSIRALRDVITASRETAVYVRKMNDTGRPNHRTEARLAVLWTNLGFALHDLGIEKLAKRCQINGKHWAQPNHYDTGFLEKADISLERMERLANQILQQVKVK